jgi:hypothetical protein
MNTLSSVVIEQNNLYINADKYNTDYNFYNYNKFRMQKNLPITYRSPTLFLDGLYFELPKSRIISVNKLAGSMNYNIVISVDKTNNIVNILKKIDEYNSQFFCDNKDKFILKITKSNKRTFYRNEPVETTFTPPIKNPLIKKYTYSSFYKVNQDGKSIEISLMIKHNYLLKIIELILLNDINGYNNNNNNNNINNCSIEEKKYYDKIRKLYSLLVDTEYFELKNMDIEYELNDIELLVKFWIKSNNFIGNEKTETINMNWYICDYNL